MATTYERIKAICEKQGITINKMCTDIGISYGVMSNLKAGKTKSLSAETLTKIANYFNVLADTLLGDIKKPASEEAGWSEQDQRLITWFRSLPEEKQKAILISQDAPEDLL